MTDLLQDYDLRTHVAKYFQTARTTSPDTSVEKVGAEITTNKSRDDIDHITPMEDKKFKRKDRNTC